MADRVIEAGENRARLLEAAEEAARAVLGALPDVPDLDDLVAGRVEAGGRRLTVVVVCQLSVPALARVCIGGGKPAHIEVDRLDLEQLPALDQAAHDLAQAVTTMAGEEAILDMLTAEAAMRGRGGVVVIVDVTDGTASVRLATPGQDLGSALELGRLEARPTVH